MDSSIFKDTFNVNHLGDKSSIYSPTHTNTHIDWILYQLSLLTTIKKISFISSKWHEPPAHSAHNKLRFKLSLIFLFFLAFHLSFFLYLHPYLSSLFPHSATGCLLAFDGLLALGFWSSSRTLINDKVPACLAMSAERQRKMRQSVENYAAGAQKNCQGVDGEMSFIFVL